MLLKLWIGGLVLSAVIVLAVAAYVFSTIYYHQYPIESMNGDASFGCDTEIMNAQFSTTLQKRSDIRHPQKSIQTMFDMIDNQPFYLNLILFKQHLIVMMIKYLFKNLLVQSLHNHRY